MGLRRCPECGASYQPLVDGATLNLCSDCISAGLDDSFYGENENDDNLHKKDEDEITPDYPSDDYVPDDLDDLNYN